MDQDEYQALPAETRQRVEAKIGSAPTRDSRYAWRTFLKDAETVMGGGDCVAAPRPIPPAPAPVAMRTPKVAKDGGLIRRFFRLPAEFRAALVPVIGEAPPWTVQAVPGREPDPASGALVPELIEGDGSLMERYRGAWGWYLHQAAPFAVALAVRALSEYGDASMPRTEFQETATVAKKRKGSKKPRC